MIKYDGVDSVIKAANQVQEAPSGKLFSEAESRQKLMNVARESGCLEEVVKAFNRYDRLLRNCTNVVERKHISILGISEINKIMGLSGSYTAGGMIIGDDQKP